MKQGGWGSVLGENEIYLSKLIIHAQLAAHPYTRGVPLGWGIALWNPDAQIWFRRFNANSKLLICLEFSL